MPFQILSYDPRKHITNANIHEMRNPLHATRLRISGKHSNSTDYFNTFLVRNGLSNNLCSCSASSPYENLKV
eukprot:4465459-Amphidinium_carterae.1